MAKRKNQELHDNMIKELVKILEEKNYTNIKADIKGYNTPYGIFWKNNEESKRIPDATAGENGHIIFEVETEDSISSEHTEKQWKLFSVHANNNDGEFWAVVPSSGCSEKAENRIDELNISAEVAEVSV